MSSTRRYECFRLFVPSRYKYRHKLTITPQATGIPKIAAEDTSIVAGNIHGEKKTIPILKGTNIIIDIVGTHFNRTYQVLSRCLVHILMTKCSPNEILLQLVTGMTRIHSSLHVFSMIGLVMLFCRSVLVRDGFLLSESAFFSLSNMQEPVHALDESMWILLLSNQSIFYTPYLLFSHRFGETESTAVLAMLVFHYKITIKEEPQFASETFEERKSRILSASPILSLAYVFFFIHVWIDNSNGSFLT